MVSVEELNKNLNWREKQLLIKACEKHNIDKSLLFNAINNATFNDFEYVHDLLERTDYDILKTAFNKCYLDRVRYVYDLLKRPYYSNLKEHVLMTESLRQSDFMVIFEKIRTANHNYDKLKHNSRCWLFSRIDKRDIIGLTNLNCNVYSSFYWHYTRNSKLFTEQTIRVLKKYGSTKCHLYVHKIPYNINNNDLRNLFAKICKNEPIYSLIYSIHISHNRRFYDLHKQLMPKIRKYVAFKNGCKLLLSICEDTQNEVTEMATTNDFIFGNDYLLNRIVRFL